ncbi:MAG: hypothetical protein LBO72_07800 [Helicobacteraceae bacterium]|jgi:hypothetical protein|nr:hypothetical protein [Helicobacteraceae bacterium]
MNHEAKVREIISAVNILGYLKSRESNNDSSREVKNCEIMKQNLIESDLHIAIAANNKELR